VTQYEGAKVNACEKIDGLSVDPIGNVATFCESRIVFYADGGSNDFRVRNRRFVTRRSLRAPAGLSR
jgi:hypothetical protein